MSNRGELRAKQDHLIALAEQQGISSSLQISCNWPGSPTVEQLRYYLYPDYVAAIDWATRYLERQAGL